MDIWHKMANETFRKQSRHFSTLSLILLSFIAEGQVSVSRLISDGMVLQRDMELKLWGWAAPNELIHVQLEEFTESVNANAKGEWLVYLPPRSKGGPYTLYIKASNELIIDDIYFGDIWVCSGQSNMELPMRRVKERYKEEFIKDQFGIIRQFVVPDEYDFKVRHDDFSSGKWTSLSPSTLGEFSAIGYFFAQEVSHKVDVPIGIINVALGGSPIEAWMSETSLKSYPEAWQEMQKFKNDSLINVIQEEDKMKHEKWYGELEEKDSGISNGKTIWVDERLNDDDWEITQIPTDWNQLSTGDIDGSIWFRKKVNVPKTMIGKPASLWMGRIVDQDFVYINGTLIGTTGYQYPPRRYYFDSGVLIEGDNQLTVRVINNRGLGEFVRDKPYFIATDSDTISIEGEWKYKLGAVMGELKSQTFIRWKPGGLFNKMIHPLLNYNIKGVLWYQGESNVAKPQNYASKMMTMIDQWRKDWGQEDFPFLFVQLANYLPSKPQPEESDWALLRNEQQKSLEAYNTGMAVTIDLGEWNDIHPEDKKTVAHRLALLALDNVYGNKEVISQSPRPAGAIFSDDDVEISFHHDDTGLKIIDGEKVNNLAISNDGINFRWAESTLKNGILRAWHPSIENPIVVRYAWANNPGQINFYSNSGLPVTPFEIKIK